jgi:hypothetical protein
MPESTDLFTYFTIISSLFFGYGCYRLAKKRDRNEIIWAATGLFFGIFALLTLLLLPKKTKISKSPIKETAGKANVMHNEQSAALDDDAFETPKAPRLSSSKNLNWYYISATESTEIKGPFGINDLRKEIHGSKLDGGTYVWCEEFEDWTLLSDFSNASLILDADFIE